MMKTMIMIIAVAVAAAAATVDEKHKRVLQASTETKNYASMRGYEACNHDELTESDCLAIGCCQWTTIDRAGNSTQHCATAVEDGAFCLRSTETPSNAPIDEIDDYDYVIDFDPYDDDDDYDYDYFFGYDDDDYDYFYYRVDPIIVIIIPVMIVCAIIVACCFYYCCCHTIRTNTPPPAPITGSERAQVAVAAATAIPSTTNTQGTTTALQKLSKEQRIQLYNIVFDTNGNQLTLESKHIFMKSITKNTTNGTDAEEYIDIDIGADYDQDDDDNKMFEGSFYLGVDSARFDSITEVDDEDDDDDDDDDAVGSLERGGSGRQRRHRSSE